MLFPCMRASSRISFIDDDPSFLEAMADAVASVRRCEFLHHPGDLDRLYAEQEDLLRREQQMLARIPGAESPLLAALDYFAWPGRHAIFSVLVTDQVMPAEDGVSICERHGHFGLRRILLTGAADADLAVKAFNQGSIESFLPKQTRNLGFNLRRALQDQFLHNSVERGRQLAMQMRRERFAALESVDVSNALMVILGRGRVDEYLVLGEPFGVLGLRADGRLSWIQIETREGLSELGDSLAEFGWDAPGMARVRAGEALPNVELVSQLDGIAPAIAPVEPLSEADGVLAAEFQFDWPGTVSWRTLPGGTAA
jgi:CheY-like chemotaxis protein